MVSGGGCTTCTGEPWLSKTPIRTYALAAFGVRFDTRLLVDCFVANRRERAFIVALAFFFFDISMAVIPSRRGLKAWQAAARRLLLFDCTQHIGSRV